MLEGRQDGPGHKPSKIPRERLISMRGGTAAREAEAEGRVVMLKLESMLPPDVVVGANEEPRPEELIIDGLNVVGAVEAGAFVVLEERQNGPEHRVSSTPSDKLMSISGPLVEDEEMEEKEANVALDRVAESCNSDEVQASDPLARLVVLEERQEVPGHKFSNIPSDKLMSIKGRVVAEGDDITGKELIDGLARAVEVLDVNDEGEPGNIVVPIELEERQEGPGQRPSSNPRERLISTRGGFVLVIVETIAVA